MRNPDLDNPALNDGFLPGEGGGLIPDGLPDGPYYYNSLGRRVRAAGAAAVVGINLMLSGCASPQIQEPLAPAPITAPLPDLDNEAPVATETREITREITIYEDGGVGGAIIVLGEAGVSPTPLAPEEIQNMITNAVALVGYAKEEGLPEVAGNEEAVIMNSFIDPENKKGTVLFRSINGTPLGLVAASYNEENRPQVKISKPPLPEGYKYAFDNGRLYAFISGEAGEGGRFITAGVSEGNLVYEEDWGLLDKVLTYDQDTENWITLAEAKVKETGVELPVDLPPDYSLGYNGRMLVVKDAAGKTLYALSQTAGEWRDLEAEKRMTPQELQELVKDNELKAEIINISLEEVFSGEYKGYDWATIADMQETYNRFVELNVADKYAGWANEVAQFNEMIGEMDQDQPRKTVEDFIKEALTYGWPTIREEWQALHPEAPGLEDCINHGIELVYADYNGQEPPPATLMDNPQWLIRTAIINDLRVNYWVGSRNGRLALLLPTTKPLLEKYCWNYENLGSASEKEQTAIEMGLDIFAGNQLILCLWGLNGHYMTPINEKTINELPPVVNSRTNPLKAVFFPQETINGVVFSIKPFRVASLTE